MKFKKIQNFIKATIINSIAYLVQFVMMPLFLPRYFPRSNEAYWIFGVTVIVTAVIAFFVLKLKMRHLLVADVMYFLLIIMYCGGAYGIGFRGINLDGMQATFYRSNVPLGAVIATAVLLLIQLIFALIANCISRVKIKILRKES